MRTEADRNDEMPAEIDFSKGTRGKFAKPGATLTDVQAYLVARAEARGVDLSQLVNELLEKDIELIEAAR